LSAVPTCGRQASTAVGIDPGRRRAYHDNEPLQEDAIMTSMPNLRWEVTNALVAEGFRRGRRVHRKPIDEEWSLLVDTGVIGKESDIAPAAGLRSEQVERLLRELCALPSGGDPSGTVGANVGYIVDGEYRSWLRLPGGSPVTVEEVVGTIHAALDRLARYANLDRLDAAWAELPDTRLDPSTPYRRVIVRFLLDDRPGVDRELAAAQDAYCFRDDEICADFQAFRGRLLARL
jgi:hypothetical protein